MDYKEKYNAALERAKEALMTSTTYQMFVIQEIFPELKKSDDEKIRLEIRNFIWEYPNKLPERTKWLAWFEKHGDINETSAEWSEEDEKKRKCLIKGLEDRMGFGWASDPFSREEYIDWLKSLRPQKQWKPTEKQGEQPTDKVEPKFKVGDWITNGGANPCYVKSIFGDYYELCSCEGFKYTKHIIDVNYTYRLWSIDDANDGDILLSSEGYPFIFSGEYDDKHFGNPIAYCGVTCENKFKEGEGTHWTRKNGVVPATKAQRDMLFTKMREAGFKWNADKKELKKIDIKTIDCDKVIGWLQNYLSNVTCYGDIFVKQFKKDFGL